MVNLELRPLDVSLKLLSNSGMKEKCSECIIIDFFHSLATMLKNVYFTVRYRSGTYRIMAYYRVARFSRFCLENMGIIFRGF